VARSVDLRKLLVGQSWLWLSQTGRLRSQFTSIDFIEVLQAAEIAISMDGKGAWPDNIFVERLWRTVKYEEIYLKAYASVSEARASIGRYLAFYNPVSLHPSVYAVEVKRFC